MKKLVKKRISTCVTLYIEGAPGLPAILMGAYKEGGACYGIHD